MVLFIGTGAHPPRPRISTPWLSQVYPRDLWSAGLRGNAEPDRSRPFTPQDESRDMVKLGYKLMAEEHGPAALVRNTVRAEQAGFAFAAISDHFFPWLDEQGHAPFAWSVLGAAAQATRQIQLMTAVTCPIMRYHPAIIAQGAATLGVLSGGRFILGLGAGERLNEHIIGQGWPGIGERHERLSEAYDIISGLLDGSLT